MTNSSKTCFRSWFKYNPNTQCPAASTYSCYHCSVIGDKNIGRNKSPSKLSNKDGVLESTMSENRQTIYQHDRGIIHRRNIEKYKSEYLENSHRTTQEIIESLYTTNDPTEFHLHLTYLERRTKQAHANHAKNMDLFLSYHKTLKIAEHCKTIGSSRNAGLSIG